MNYHMQKKKYDPVLKALYTKGLIMEQVHLKYGASAVDFTIEEARSVAYLHANPMRVIENIKDEFIHCITDQVIDSPPLNQLIQGDDKVTIVISDMTRFWMRQDILCELLVKYLREEIGVAFENIAVVIALGTHRKNSEEDKRKLAGEYVYTHVASVEDHDCDAPDLVYVGTTSFGTEVRVNPLAVGRKLICIGGTVHHLMAGYGGGRKSIVPGIASRETIRMNHQMALDPAEPKSDIRIGSGKTLVNPIHQDMCEAAGLVHVTFGINIVVDSASRHSGLFCGCFDTAWKESCRYVQKCYGLPIDYEADIVIASCGGFPKDLNFYQSTKSLFNGSRAVKEGGTLILLAECPEGSGARDFFDWIEPLKKGCLDEALRKDFTIGGYIFYAACESIRKSRTLLLSRLEPEVIQDMGVTSYKDMDTLLKTVDFKDKDVYIIPYGGSLMPQLKEEYQEFCKNI